MLDEKRTLGWALAAVGMLLVSTDSIFVRLAQESEASAWDIAFLVSVFSIPVQLLLNVRFEDATPSEAIRAHPGPIMLVGLLAGVSQIAFITAITRTSISNVVVIVAAAPIFAALFAWLAMGERTATRVWVGIAVTLAGILVVASGSLGQPTLGGDALALLAIVSFGGNTVIWRRYPDMSRFVGLTLSATVTLVLAAYFARPFSLMPAAYAAIAAMGFVFNPAGRIAHSNAPRFAPAAEVALFSPVETVAATAMAWVVFSEEPKVATMVGGVIVLAGVFVGTIGVPQRLQRPSKVDPVL